MLDTYILKLQYEVLNLSKRDIATSIGVPLSVVEDASDGWRRRWPEDDFFISDEELDSITAVELMERQTEFFVEQTKKRVAIFQLLKDRYLLAKYALAESAILDKAYEMIGRVLEPGDLKGCTAALKDVSTFSQARNLTEAMYLSEDILDIPTVLIRNVSGDK